MPAPDISRAAGGPGSGQLQRGVRARPIAVVKYKAL